MKKKTLVIELITGRLITRDISTENFNAPFGAGANDVNYAMFCQAVCVNGYTDPDLVSDKQYTHIAPSQIKSVSVKFEETVMKVKP